MGQLYKVLKIDIFESCSWLGPLGVLIHQKKIWPWVRLLRRYRLPKWAKMSVRAIFTNKRNFFLRDDLKHSKNQSGPKWPHLSIFSLKFCGNWRSGPPGCGYVSSKFVGGPEMCFYWKIRNFYIFLVHFFFKFIRKTWANQFRGVRVLWAHSGVTKLENLCFLINFCSFFLLCRP